MKKIFILGNGIDWCEKSLIGFRKYENVRIINDRFLVKNKIARFLIKRQYSKTLNKRFNVPMKGIWYGQFCKKIELSNDDNCLLIYDHNPLGGDFQFLMYVRRKYPKIKLAYIFTNIIKHSAAHEMNYVDNLNNIYNIVFAFDLEDAKNYNFAYSPLIYDADPSYKKEEKESKENLVFYVGQAKDRLPGLFSCFEKLKSLGIKTDFHIANVKEEDMKYSGEIEYNKFMTYEECVSSIQRATCLVDIIQGDSTGLTIKTCEAVCYDKKLITTNKHVVEYPFYDPRFIKVIDSSNDIDESFFCNNKDVQYSEEGKRYFSADKFLERIEKGVNI